MNRSIALLILVATLPTSSCATLAACDAACAAVLFDTCGLGCGGETAPGDVAAVERAGPAPGLDAMPY